MLGAVTAGELGPADEERGRQRVGRGGIGRDDRGVHNAARRPAAARVEHLPVAVAVDDDEPFPLRAAAERTVLEENARQAPAAGAWRSDVSDPSAVAPAKGKRAGASS